MAKKILKRNPPSSRCSPIVAFLFTLGAGTGFIYYSLIPVIYAVAYFNKVRPERLWRSPALLRSCHHC